MKLIIQVRNGQVYEHPILVENFQQAFSSFDVDNLPEGFAYFERKQPVVGVYEIYVGTTYQKDDRGWFVDTHDVRPMTLEEKQEKINKAMLGVHFPSWVFSEELCRWVAPVPIPENGNFNWDEENLQWVEASDACSWNAGNLGVTNA